MKAEPNDVGNASLDVHVTRAHELQAVRRHNAVQFFKKQRELCVFSHLLRCGTWKLVLLLSGRCQKQTDLCSTQHAFLACRATRGGKCDSRCSKPRSKMCMALSNESTRGYCGACFKRTAKVPIVLCRGSVGTSKKHIEVRSGDI